MSKNSQSPRPLSVFHILGNLFTALSGAYGLSVAGFLGLRALIGEASNIIGFLDNFLHLLMLPSLILLPIFMLLGLVRRRASFLLLALLQIPAAFTFLRTY